MPPCDFCLPGVLNTRWRYAVQCSGSLDRTIRLWQPHAAECLHVIMQLEDPPFCILAISPSPGGATGWASITREGTVSFWKGSTFREAINLNAPLASATEVLELDVLLTGTGVHIPHIPLAPDQLNYMHASSYCGEFFMHPLSSPPSIAFLHCITILPVAATMFRVAQRTEKSCQSPSQRD